MLIVAADRDIVSWGFALQPLAPSGPGHVLKSKSLGEDFAELWRQEACASNWNYTSRELCSLQKASFSAVNTVCARA